jgi:transposase InsO family protein
MGWAETNPVNERRRFIQDYESGQWTMTELCERYGVSRKCGYARVQRFREEGPAGLEDRSRAPKSCPHRTPEELEQLIIAERKTLRWGARKLLRVLSARHPGLAWPARSTISDILERHGLVKQRRRRRKWQHPGAVPPLTSEPNDLWTTDFKGQFRTGDGIYCYPLTIVDLHSRYLLRVHALPNVRTEGAKPVFERLFREVGMPAAIRSDNGPPFASTGIHGLCELNAWWMRLGITHQRIQPASPQQNGAHERMHRTLKQETTRPPGPNHRAQQRRFDSFRMRFNEERPHEALGDETPASIWVPSRRPFPERILPPEYPGHCEVRRVSTAGTFRLFNKQMFLSHALADEYVGLEEIDDGLWNILFYGTLLGRFDQATNAITGADFRTTKG